MHYYTFYGQVCVNPQCLFDTRHQDLLRHSQGRGVVGVLEGLPVQAGQEGAGKVWGGMCSGP